MPRQCHNLNSIFSSYKKEKENRWYFGDLKMKKKNFNSETYSLCCSPQIKVLNFQDVPELQYEILRELVKWY